MPLRHLLFRCPYCGYDPMVGSGGTADCSGCQIQISHGAIQPLHLAVRRPKAPDTEVPIAELLELVEGQGGALTQARSQDGKLCWSAQAELKTGTSEVPIRWKDHLLGFFERFHLGTPGQLRLDGDTLFFDHNEAEAAQTWPLTSFTSLQSASSSIQFTTDGGELVHVAFETDSPRRWEILLREALQMAWTADGRGEIVEVQPRIRVRA
jgi:hypothetical protein